MRAAAKLCMSLKGYSSLKYDRSVQVLEKIKKRDPDQKEFIQAVNESLESLEELCNSNPKYYDAFEVMAEPERVIQFRVHWRDDKGKMNVNRGFRIQASSAIGGYKGGLRFHPSVNLSILKFLAFEQILKNSLTTLMMGGGKGGSDFDPKGKSDNEVYSFCNAFMGELFRHIDHNLDVPAGDIGVGAREIGYLFGAYKKYKNRFEAGVLTGKSLPYGGSLIRPEATGYGSVWFANEMLKSRGDTLKGKKALISGSGNVAQYTVEKLHQYGAIPLTLSDSDGTIYEPNGITPEGLAFIMDLKNNKRGRIQDYLKYSKTAEYIKGKKPWKIAADMAFPSATQNEILGADALDLVKGGVMLVSEGANMPSNPEAQEVYYQNNFLYGPAKAANCAGVACSGLEMAQNSQRLSWTRNEVEERLHNIMITVHKNCYDTSKMMGVEGNLKIGADVCGFIKVAEAMIAYGI
jgi:glutamate dehydrogenase (NADP+)